MKRIVLLRHGESLWNKENRFTGWTDVDLSEKGVEEACKAGDALRGHVALRQRAKSLGAKGNCGCFSMFLLFLLFKVQI